MPFHKPERELYIPVLNYFQNEGSIFLREYFSKLLHVYFIYFTPVYTHILSDIGTL